MSWFFSSGGQSIRASVSASVLPMNIQDWFPLGLTGLIFLLSKELSRVFSSITLWRHQFFTLSLFYCPALTSIHDYLKKTVALNIQMFVSKIMSLLFNTLSMFVIAFHPWNKRLLISWLQSPSAMILETKKIKSVTVTIVSPFIYHEVIGPDAVIFVSWMLNFKPAFSISSSSRGSLVPLHFLPSGWFICISEAIDISPSNLDSSLCFTQSGILCDVLCI